MGAAAACGGPPAPKKGTPPYAELQLATGFSFLEGASHPNELAATAAVLGLTALGITDRNSVAGVVRLHEAVKKVNEDGADLHLRVGSRLSFTDGTPDLLCYPTDRPAWSRLTRLLTVGKNRAPKGQCHLTYADLAEHVRGQVLVLVPPPRPDAAFTQAAERLSAEFRRTTYLALTRQHRADDVGRLRRLATLAATLRLPTVATNDVLYHAPDRRPLHDVLTCIRLGCTIDQAGLGLQPNAERHLKPPAEMARLFKDHPGAIERTMEIVDRCRFSLDDLRYEYPDEPVPPGLTPDGHLSALAWSGAADRYPPDLRPGGIPAKVQASLHKELGLIAQLGYAAYFLTVHDIVRYARSKGILCQGRGSSANSVVCFCLRITEVDPDEIDLLFDRFVSAERKEPPDIDVDFEHERREEVIQYVYERYGRHRAGIIATVIHYRPKMAIREVGKVMGLAEDATAALSAQSWNAGGELWNDDHVREAGLDPASPVVQRAVALARDLTGLPRHLSQHVGGFVLTRGRLDDIVPFGPAAMEGRSFIEWDKDDVDALCIMKVDVLALGMLTCIHRAFDLLRGNGIELKNTGDIPREDPAVYRMLQRGDSLGVFQVESRAQMNMLPRLKPAKFYDLVIEVAIVRPGPIQGDMVHPYLRRRAGQEEVVYPSPTPGRGEADELKRVLGKTLGVPLFQEQAMRLAIVAAEFSSEDANRLRRAMATFRNVGTIHGFGTKLVEGMVARGYDRTFAENCFNQIRGFGTYGFPQSHAAAFAWLVYVSAWLKCHHPAAFACALLNSQPMGFYAPAQIVRDAREHGVQVRGIDVNASAWDCTLEGGALRLGLRLVTGLHAQWGTFLAGKRFADFTALARSSLSPDALERLARADALRSLGLDRRAALWQVHGLRRLETLPLFTQISEPARPAALPHMTLPEHVVADYQTAGLSLKAHPLRFLRTALSAEGVRCCAEAAALPDNAKAAVAGVVLVRQRPGSAKGVVFATIEDETGIANVVIWPSLIERFRREMLTASLLLVHGHIQRSPEGIVHLVAETLHDRTPALRRLSDEIALPDRAHADGMPAPNNRPLRSPKHPRDERVIPPSRDFH